MPTSNDTTTLEGQRGRMRPTTNTGGLLGGVGGPHTLTAISGKLPPTIDNGVLINPMVPAEGPLYCSSRVDGPANLELCASKLFEGGWGAPLGVNAEYIRHHLAVSPTCPVVKRRFLLLHFAPFFAIARSRHVPPRLLVALRREHVVQGTKLSPASPTAQLGN